jgi:hypothetical protein
MSSLISASDISDETTALTPAHNRLAQETAIENVGAGSDDLKDNMADRKNKVGLSVAIGAGVGAALDVALQHLPSWLSLGCVGGVVTGII